MLLFALVVVLSACANAGVTGPEPAGSPDTTVSRAAMADVWLAVGQTSTIASLEVTFVGVTDDSRCPRGVTCVWEGDAVVELRVRAGQSAAETVRLHANPRFEQEAVVAGVRLRLVKLEPYPEADRPIAAGEYRVVLSVGAEPTQTE